MQHRFEDIALNILGITLVAVLIAGSLCGCPTRNPDAAQIHLRLAGSAYTRNQMAEAMREALEAERLDPEDGDVQNLLAALYLQQDRFMDARIHANRALDLDDRRPATERISSALHNLIASIDLTEKKYDDCLREAQIALDDPTYGSKHLPKYNKAMCLAGKGSQDAAVQLLREATMLNPKFCIAYEGLGQVYMSRGNFADAIEQFHLAVTADAACKALQTSWFYLGSCYERLTKTESALASYRSCAEVDARNALGQRCVALVAKLQPAAPPPSGNPQ